MFVVNPALWCLDHPPLGDLPPTPPSSHGSVTQQLGDQLSLTRIFKWEGNGKNPQHLQQSAHLQHEHVGLCSLMLLRKWNWVIWILGKWWKDLTPLLTSLPRGFTSTDLSGSVWGPFLQDQAMHPPVPRGCSEQSWGECSGSQDLQDLPMFRSSSLGVQGYLQLEMYSCRSATKLRYKLQRDFFRTYKLKCLSLFREPYTHVSDCFSANEGGSNKYGKRKFTETWMFGTEFERQW